MWIPITVKVPKNLGAFRAVLAKEMDDDVVSGATEDFEAFVSTFSSANKAKILVETKIKVNEMSIFTGVKSNWSKGKKANASDKFMFLTRGTSKRYAKMSSTFKAKSRKGVIKSGGGGGQRTPLFVNASIPQNGIEARDIEEAVFKKNKTKIVKKMQLAVNKASLAVKI